MPRLLGRIAQVSFLDVAHPDRIILFASAARDATRFVAVGETHEHGPEVFIGSLPLPMPNRPDYVGAPPPAVWRLTFSNR